MTEQELNCSQVLRPAIDQRYIRTSHRVGAVHSWIKANSFYPRFDVSGVLAVPVESEFLKVYRGRYSNEWMRAYLLLIG